MLFNPIIRWPFQSIDEYREETFTIGSPSVFHTAPPHPASNARITCSPQFVGGAEASQNGLRHGIPQKLVSSVGLGLDMLHLQPRGNADARAFSVRDCVHNLPAPISAITAGKELRVGSLACRPVNEDASAFQLNLLALAFRFNKKTRMRPLPDRQNNQIRLK